MNPRAASVRGDMRNQRARTCTLVPLRTACPQSVRLPTDPGRDGHAVGDVLVCGRVSQGNLVSTG